MYQHPVTLLEPGSGSYDAGTKVWTKGDSEVLWMGKADVQEESRGLQYLRRTSGETTNARLEVFFRETDWSKVLGILRLELICETPIGTGPVVGIRNLDQMIAIEPTKIDA